MTMHNIVEFVSRCDRDPALKDQAKAIGIHNIDGQIGFATALGLPFDHADIEALKASLAAEGVLSEDDLEMVAGGGPLIVLGALLGTTGFIGGIGFLGGGW